MKIDNYIQLLKSRILMLDGAMGTMIMRRGLLESDFRGKIFASHPVRLSGCNDILSLTAPDVIKDIHRQYLEAGCDIITTNTFNANAVSLSDYGLGEDENLISEINRKAARIAVEVVSEVGLRVWGGHPLVAGSVGPTNRTASMSPDVADPACRNVDYDMLFKVYSTQISALVEGGVDLILFETVFDTLNLKAGLDAANHVMKKTGDRLPIMISATVADKSGRTLSGQTLDAFIASVASYDNVVSLGLNCSFGPSDIITYLRTLSENTDKFVSCYPNAGLPNALGEYDETPEMFATHMSAMMEERLLNVAGGCCGTTPRHLAELRKVIDEAQVRIPPILNPALCLSGLDCLEVIPENNFVNVGERCNVAGSRKFLRLIKEKKYDEAIEIASRQVADGAMMIDVNMDDALLDARSEMVHFLRCVASDPDVARVPVMIDSSDWDVVENALKNIQGKSIVNSISLKEGEDEFIRKATRIRELGASVIVMAFDENGQADTFQRKIDVSLRAYNLLLEKCGYDPQDIIFDVNIMAIATGMDEHRLYGIDFIRAVKWIKDNLPGVRTSGGVSNLSFAFRGKNVLREAMHAVFLYHAIQAGLDMAIMNPSSTVTYEEIEPSLRRLLEDVILARRDDAQDELTAWASGEEIIVKKKTCCCERDISLPVSVRLSEALVKGRSEFLEADLDEAVSMGMSPVEIIEGSLMDGMNKVGEMFGEGKMFLPQVVKTARTMKLAVDHLRPLLEAGRDNGVASAGKMVIATVKGDVHDIGKNIVSIVMACNNYEVIDLGVMVPAEKIMETVLREKPDMVALSGLITPSLSEMVNIVKCLQRGGMTVPVIVGGATTSKLHTALKIDIEYEGAVIHASDASRNPVIASLLMNPDERETYVKSIKEEYAHIREEYSKKIISCHSISEARKIGLQNKKGQEYVKQEVEFGIPTVVKIKLDDIIPLINWKMFFHAWKMSGSYMEKFPYHDCKECVSSWLSGIKEHEREKAQQALSLYKDAVRLLSEIKNGDNYDGKGAFVFYPSYSKTDSIVVGDTEFPVLRQQREDSDCMSIADFVKAKEDGGDVTGLFAVSSGKFIDGMISCFKEAGDSYRSILCQSLADRLAEASSEWLEHYVESEKGYYVSIRPAMGYPMLPDQLLNKRLSSMLPMSDLGVTVTENGAMSPSSSVSGFYIGNPSARYFMVGEIGNDQLEEYAEKRNLSVGRIKEILNL